MANMKSWENKKGRTTTRKLLMPRKYEEKI
jgi:hypothetical protein